MAQGHQQGARGAGGAAGSFGGRVFSRSSIGDAIERLGVLFRSVPQGVFSLPPNEKHDALLGFLNDAVRDGIDARGAMRFLRVKKYEWRLKNWRARDKDQVPSLLLLGSTSGVNLSVVTGPPTFEHGVQFGGAFGPAINVRGMEDVHAHHDLTPIAYILNHLRDHGRELPPYLWVLGEFDSSNPKSPSLEQAAQLALYRLGEFKSELERAGFLVSRDNVLLTSKDGAPESLALLAVVYNSSERTFSVVERSERGSVSFTPFEQFIAKHSLKDDSVVKAHVVNMRVHRESDVHYHDYRAFGESAKTVACVDCRSNRPGADKLLKTIGAVLSERDFLRIARNNSQLDTVEILFHTPCGYVNSAIALHEFFKQLNEVRIDSSVKKIVFRKIAQLMRGEHADLDVAAYSRALSLAPEAKQVLSQLFGARGDLRNILRHMAEHGVFAKADGGVEMTAAASIEKKLSTWRVEVEPAHFKLLVLEELVRMELERKAHLLEANKQELEQARGKGNGLTLSFLVEDYKSGRIWMVPAQLTKDNVHSATREDAFLAEQVDVSHFMKPSSGAKH
ncbi:hypothetical protein HY992_04440 [Candidatus Micrarchaeota archaeon]|nr:hypothetical protein [Candidatus Micrarchaeota archaeon]